MSNIIFIVGPTASGKTDAAFSLAKELNAEIISCDSMLIYKEPKIITSKPSRDILREIKHHFIDIISVKDSYSVFDYYKQASKKIIDLYESGIDVIVCGGSGLYMKALLDGLFEEPSKDEEFRERLEEEAKLKGSKALHDRLNKIDKAAAKKISSNDLRRIIRALEVYHLTGKLISEKKNQTSGLYGKYPIKIFSPLYSRELLYKRIDERTDQMFFRGALDEIKKLLKLNLSLTAEKIIGLKEVKEYIEDKVDESQMRENIKRNTRRFAKRQLTWFRADKRVEWIEADALGIGDIKMEVLKRVDND